MPSSEHILHPDMDTIIGLLEKQPIRMFARNCTPPKDPPLVTPEPGVWECHKCKQRYKISVTSRCLWCPSYNSTAPYMYLSGDSPDGAPTRKYRKSPLSRNITNAESTKKSKKSKTTRKSRTNRVYSERPSPSMKNYDYEFWGQYNDWKRFRSEYEDSPERWETRIKRSFNNGLDSAQRRAKRYKFEVERRTSITEERLDRMLKRKHNCELDCDYPGQCQTELEEEVRKRARKEKDPRGKMYIMLVDQFGKRAGKLPLCKLLPRFDQEIVSARAVGDDDAELFAEFQEDADDCHAWRASTLARLAKETSKTLRGDE
ncbi:hypothetical protein FGADI_8745 [Fusarium gaditjirri]|uniref:Uncharacterized protein n=1 Tax=Fusarium gaditjirri TaxID=282569 RepID=A0A8H4WTH8_9HYPO|nr:hypothetical protein FGADI_8745 [Fusarium gaditjirri]